MTFASLLARVDAAVLSVLKDDGVTYTPGGGAAVPVKGVFDAAYLLVDANHSGVTTCTPVVFVRLADLPSDPDVDLQARVTVAGAVYRIHESKADGKGTSILVLTRD